MTPVRRRFTIGRVLGATALGCLLGPLTAWAGTLVAMSFEPGFSLFLDPLLFAIPTVLYGLPLCLTGVMVIGWPTILILNAGGRCSRAAVVASAVVVALAVGFLIPMGSFILPLGCIGAGAGLALGLGPLNRTTLDSAPQDA